jgi:hypothetical protein
MRWVTSVSLEASFAAHKVATNTSDCIVAGVNVLDANVARVTHRDYWYYIWFQSVNFMDSHRQKNMLRAYSLMVSKCD